MDKSYIKLKEPQIKGTIEYLLPVIIQGLVN